MFVFVVGEEFYLMGNVLLLLFVLLGLHSIRPLPAVCVTTDVRTSSTTSARHVPPTVSGTRINAFVLLDSSVLEVNAELVTQEPHTMELTVTADWDISETEISALLATIAVVNVVDLKPINVWLVQMFPWFFKMDSAQRILLATLVSSWTMDNAQNVWTTVLNVRQSSSARLAPLDTRPIPKNSQDKELSAVRKSVEMVSSMNRNVMMEIPLMVMDVLALVKKNKDGSAVVDLPMLLVSARNTFRILSNFPQRVLSILVVRLFSV